MLLPLLMVWIAGSGVLVHRYLRRRRAWSRSRLGLTHELVERMVGHRTRLAQEGPALHDHTADRHQLEMLDRRARTMDRTAAVLAAAVPRGWVVAGLATMFVALPVGTDPARIAAGLGGVLLAFHGLEKLGLSLTQLTDAVVAWDHVGPLLRTTGAGPDPIDPAPAPRRARRGLLRLRRPRRAPGRDPHRHHRRPHPAARRIRSREVHPRRAPVR